MDRGENEGPPGISIFVLFFVLPVLLGIAYMHYELHLF
jgi:hypothetical protein